MKLRNYCIIVMGETEGILPEIVNVADNTPNTLDGGGIFIATFTSFAKPSELTDYFKQRDWNFFIFDLSSQSSGYNILKEDINEGLFGFLRQFSNDDLRERTKGLIQELTSSTVANTSRKIPIKSKVQKTRVLLEDIDKMSPKDKQKLFDALIDKGPQKLSEYDKKLLKKLSVN